MFVSCGRQITYEKENSDVKPLRGKMYVTNLSMLSANYVTDAGSGVAQYKKLRVRGSSLSHTRLVYKLLVTAASILAISN